MSSTKSFSSRFAVSRFPPPFALPGRRKRFVLASSSYSSSLANAQPTKDDANNAKKSWNTNLRCSCEQMVFANEERAMTSDPGLSLSRYMRLPVEQYVDVPLPMNASMSRVGSGEGDEDGLFELAVPGLEFFWLEVQPRVRVRVTVMGEEARRKVWSGVVGGSDEADEDGRRPEREDADMRGPCVLIEVVSCTLEGKEVEKLGINEMFVNRGTTAFRWKSRGDASWMGKGKLRHYGEGSTEYDDGKEGEMEQGGGGGATEGGRKAFIKAWTEIGVGVDPPGPFKKLPRKFAQKVGDAVLGFTLNTIEKAFLRGLAKDYERWSTDEVYREKRREDLKDVAWSK